MSLTKADYHARGVHNAAIDAAPRDGRGGRYEVPNPGSWQRAAYDAGYNTTTIPPTREAVRAAPVKTALQAALEDRNDRAFAKWPKPAREHLRMLSLDIGSTTPERNARLLRAVSRMIKRHGPIDHTQKVRDFPISTQPHPDGPITVGMLLNGQ